MIIPDCESKIVYLSKLILGNSNVKASLPEAEGTSIAVYGISAGVQLKQLLLLFIL